jgi:3'-phosphoadenosine 5'-phosphosulfate sulfotransferase (PAPS reductase)/FAD synthetase
MTNGRRTVWNWNPILHWKETEVRSYLAERGIPLHPVYQHLNRFSCRVCIFQSDHDLRQVKEHDPAAIDIIAGIEERIGFTMFQRGGIRTLAETTTTTQP